MNEDATVMAIGVPNHVGDGSGTVRHPDSRLSTNPGVVYIFIRRDGAWQQQTILSADNTEGDDSFGHSVSLSADGNSLAVGAPGEDSGSRGVNGDKSNNSASWSGAAYVFVRSGDSWLEQAYLKASNADAGDRFGSEVSLSADGETLAVGAIFERSQAHGANGCLLYTSPSPRDKRQSRMPSSA